MASRWADRLSRVAPPRVQPKAVTVVFPYYENQRFLLRQAESWRGWPDWVRARLAVIVVDDGSPTPARLPPDCHARLFRIGVDVPWNWLAARNIGVHEAATDWVVLTDIDHVVTSATAEAIVLQDHDPRVAYAFDRIEHTGAPVAPHSASFLLTRQLFWKVGGYDEALSGHYGTDGDWRRRLAVEAQTQVLRGVALVRHEHVLDSSTVRYQRKLPQDAAAVTALVAARRPGWRPKVLSFSYAEVRP